jgi:hypothetical protein
MTALMTALMAAFAVGEYIPKLEKSNTSIVSMSILIMIFLQYVFCRARRDRV